METNPHFWSKPQLGFPVPQRFDHQPPEYPPYPHGNYPDQIPQPTHGNYPDQIPQSNQGNYPDGNYPDQIPQSSRIQPRVRQSNPQPSPPKRKPPRSPMDMAHQPPFGPQAHQPPFGSQAHHELDPYSQPKPMSRPKPTPQKPRPHHPTNDNFMYPTPDKTQPATRFGAVFCCILWLIIILAGFLVLVIYLVYKPQSPKFEISNAGLNAANLDMGTVLNVDLTILANFSNPNSKGDVEFGYVTLHLYFNQKLIANQYIQPFSTVNSESKLAYVEMVASEVRLPPEVNQEFMNQVQRNRIMFEVDAIFHAKSNFRSLFKFSNWLYGKCIIEMTGPPTGVLIASKCRMKK